MNRDDSDNTIKNNVYVLSPGFWLDSFFSENTHSLIKEYNRSGDVSTYVMYGSNNIG